MIPKSVSSIGDEAFVKNQLTAFRIPGSLTEMGVNIFDGNPLTDVEIFANLTTMEFRDRDKNLIFNNIRTLKSVIIYDPESCERVKSWEIDIGTETENIQCGDSKK